MKLFLLCSFLFCLFLYAHCAESNDDGSESADGPSARGIRHWSKRDRVILDCDGGLADITGLLILLRAEARHKGPRLHAVTLTRREILVEELAKNVARALVLENRPEIPYFLGADASLTDTPFIGGRRFGNDALGDVPYDPTGLPPPQKEIAALALIRMVNELKGNAVIITTGALTNIALAIRLDKTFLSKVKTIFIGAGAVAGIGGNVLPGIEYKAWRDPEALKAVLSNTHYQNAYLFANDAAFEANADIPTKFWMDKFFAIQDPTVQFIKAASQVYWNNGAPEGYALNDPMVVSTFIFPRIIESCEPHSITVSTACECRGALFGGVTDFSNWRDDPEKSNVYVIKKIDAKGYVNGLLKLFGPEKSDK